MDIYCTIGIHNTIYGNAQTYFAGRDMNYGDLKSSQQIIVQ